MSKRSAIVFLLLALAAPALAQVHVFPPLVSGQYSFHVQAAAVETDSNGVPLTPATRSVGVFNVSDPVSLLACVDVAAGDLASVSVTLTANGDRAEIRARAYQGTGCSGEASEDSANAAFMYFTGPQPPEISE